MRNVSGITFIFILFLIFTTKIQANPRTDARIRAQKAADAFSKIMKAPDNGIPGELLDRAWCVAVFPAVKKAGFILGGQYGRGLISCRRSPGSWGAPSFFTIGGGSIGLQVGGQEVDLVLLIMNQAGVDGLLQNRFELGAGAAVSAGPVGRNTSASTDILLKSQVISYSRSRGLFAGLELKGAVLSPDNDANEATYQQPVTARDIILEGKVRAPESIVIFQRTLARYSPPSPRK
jgi:SH3 domain-containing YSC84-like protein 1